MKRLTLSSLLILSMTAHGHTAAPKSEPPFRSAGGAFLALSVADLQQSARWYAEKLGLEVVMQSPKRDGAAVIVLEGGGLIVELVQLDEALPLSNVTPSRGAPQLVHGFFKAGIVVDDLDGTVARLKQRGVAIAFGPFPRRDNQRANVLIRDNAGNLIQLLGR